ncbi:MAG: phage major tail tube protein [Oscillospiraceae bacterium]|nr:phage major tail tube protein [Oscillospiraceae bacterium]
MNNNTKKINETTISFSVYAGATEYIGTAQATLPEIALKTENINGAGLPGEYEAVITGQTNALNMSLQFRGLSRDVVALMAKNNNIIELRPVSQVRDLGGTPQLAAQKHVFSCQAKNLKPGDIAPGSPQNVTVDFAVYRWEAFENGKSVLEIDKLNFIHKINGVDQLAEIRKMMGRV